MKKFYAFLIALSFFAEGKSQIIDSSGDKLLSENINKTLTAATTMCVVSFIYQGTGAILILSYAGEMPAAMGLGLAIGIGGVGMATNNAILTNRAYNQIEHLNFLQEDSALRMNMLKNMKAARTLTILQNLTPILGVAAGFIGYSCYRAKNETEDTFYESTSFWIPAISICAIGLVLTIPEIILIEKARNDLKTYQQKLSLGKTEYGLGMIFKF
ncbi:MAG: hypothetical protein WCI48_06025 [Bacteroidota bacterium]|jgi:hypothetical protein